MYFGLVSGFCVGMAIAAVIGVAYDSNPHNLKPVIGTAVFFAIIGTLPAVFDLGSHADNIQYFEAGLPTCALVTTGMICLSNYFRKRRQ